MLRDSDQVHGQKEAGPAGMWDSGTGGANGDNVVAVDRIRAAPLAFCQTALTAAAIPVHSSSPLGSPQLQLCSALGRPSSFRALSARR